MKPSEVPREWVDAGVFGSTSLPSMDTVENIRAIIAPVTPPAEVEGLRAEVIRAGAECADAMAQVATLRARVAELEAALREYKLLFCEGYCSEIPGMHEDCSGCIARAALEGSRE